MSKQKKVAPNFGTFGSIEGNRGGAVVDADASLIDNLEVDGSPSDSDKMREMRTIQNETFPENETLPETIPVDISTLPPDKTNELERLKALGMIESSSGPLYGSNVPTEGVPEMLRRLERLPPERIQSVGLIDARDLADIARDTSRGFPDALKFQDREMDLFPQESRASIGRAGIPVLYDPETPGATPNRWSFETPAPITPERVYTGLETPEERYRFLQRRADFVQRFKERRQSFDEESNIAGAALLGSGAVVGTALGAPAVATGLVRAAGAGLDVIDRVPVIGGLAYDTVGATYRVGQKMVEAAKNIPYAQWVGKLIEGRVIDQKWLLTADAAGVSGSFALKKIHDQAQQIETQEEAIQGLQKAMSDIQAQEEPISPAE